VIGGRAAVPLLLCTLGSLIGGLVWFPASLALRALPDPIRCAAATGTLWQGRCSRLVVQEALVGTLAWRIRPSALLGGRLSAQMAWSLRDDHLQGDLNATRHSLTLSALRGRLDFGTMRTLPIWPPGLNARLARTEGRLRVELFEGTRRGGRWVDLRGTLEGEDLAWQGPERWDLGGLRLTLGAHRPSVGEVIDTGGPLDLKAALSLEASPAWTLEGFVRARDPAWVPRLGVFGPPDPLGRHRLSIEGR
jgi:hypothetical protein